MTVYDEIKAERKYQDDIHGHDRNHAPIVWLPILGEEVGEVNRAVYEHHFEGSDLSSYREELIQVAAVAVAMIESYDRSQQ